MASNHISFGDPPALTTIKFTKFISFMAKRELFEGKKWGWWFKAMGCIPINRDGNDLGAVKEAVRRLKKGLPVAIFPEGTRSVNGEFGKPELGVGFLQDRTNVPVIPVYVKGTDKILPKGGKYKMLAPVSIYMGQPVDISPAKKIKDNRERYQAIAEKIMDAIKNIKDRVDNGTFRG